MIAAIMQPTFLPWVGYFDLVDQVDKFVFLDNVQFEKQSWQQRNKIRTASGAEWLTVPVFIKGRFGQKISNVEIKNDTFPEKQIKTLQHNYSKTKYYKYYWPKLEAILINSKSAQSLANLNIALIRYIAEMLGISTSFILASEMPASTDRSDRLVNILQNIGANEYLSPQGSMQYLIQDHQIFEKAKISILFHAFQQPEYRQRYSPFTTGLSAIDMLFNEGAQESVRLMRAARMPSIPFEKITLNY